MCTDLLPGMRTYYRGYKPVQIGFLCRKNAVALEHWADNQAVLKFAEKTMMSKRNPFHRSKPDRAENGHYPDHTENPKRGSLADLSPGMTATIGGFDSQLSSNRRLDFIAYGLSPGNQVEVLQQSPVTIIKIDNTELAMEKELARHIFCH